MGRIGDIGHSYTKIYSEALGGFEPAYDPAYDGWYSGALPDNIERWQMPINAAVDKNEIYWDYTKPLIDRLLKQKAKHRLNKTEYEMKQPKRAEGLAFKNAQDKPYLNMGEKPDADLVPMQLKDFTPQEQFKLSVTYPKMKIAQTNSNSMSDYIATVTEKQTAPHDIDNFNHESELDFIKRGRGTAFIEKSSNNAIDGFGGTLAMDYATDMNKPVGPKTTEQIYDQITSNRTQPNFNLRQQDNYTSRRLIGAFSGEPNIKGGTVAPTNLSSATGAMAQHELIANAVVRQLRNEHPMTRMRNEDKQHRKKNKTEVKKIQVREGEEYLSNLTREQLLDIARQKSKKN